MAERILTFGPREGLVGIYSEPEASTARPTAPIVVSSNVGMNHRIGPYRLYVELARRLAAQGYGTLRFDLSGMGDSAARMDDLGEAQRALADVRDAMDAVSRIKPGARFVQLGLCSGVDSAHAASLEDPRVVGAIFLESYTYRTPRFYFERYVRRTLTRRFWSIYSHRKLRQLTAPLAAQEREVGELPPVFSRSYPSSDALELDYASMIARDMQLLFVYCGGLGADAGYNYANQFADMFPSIAQDRHVQVQFYPTADHVYSVLSDRARLIERIEQWLRTHYP